jgi:hypothetical protein
MGEMPPVTHFAEVDSLRDAAPAGSSLNEPEFSDGFGTSTPATFAGRWALRGIVETHRSHSGTCISCSLTMIQPRSSFS